MNLPNLGGIAVSLLTTTLFTAQYGQRPRFASLANADPEQPFQIIPVRCFSCGKVVGDKWAAYLKLLETMSEGCVCEAPSAHILSLNFVSSSSEALTELQLKRYCCRRMVLTHVDLIEKLLQYNRTLFVPLSCSHITHQPQSERKVKIKARLCIDLLPTSRRPVSAVPDRVVCVRVKHDKSSASNQGRAKSAQHPPPPPPCRTGFHLRSSIKGGTCGGCQGFVREGPLIPSLTTSPSSPCCILEL